jgi:mono/diheme cytochrome c family protein
LVEQTGRIHTMKFKIPLLALSLTLGLGLSMAAFAAHAQDKLYSVVDGYKVDANTMKGFRTWRAAACDRCHGANQEGMVGPSLLASLKTLTKEEFVVTVRDGRLQKGMQSFGTSPQVMDNMDHLYAYLKGRSDGAITRSKVEEIK